MIWKSYGQMGHVWPRHYSKTLDKNCGRIHTAWTDKNKIDCFWADRPKKNGMPQDGIVPSKWCKQGDIQDLQFSQHCWWRFKSSEIWQCADWYTVPGITLYHPKIGNSKLLWNTGIYKPIWMSYYRSLLSSRWDTVSDKWCDSIDQVTAFSILTPCKTLIWSICTMKAWKSLLMENVSGHKHDIHVVTNTQNPPSELSFCDTHGNTHHRSTILDYTQNCQSNRISSMEHNLSRLKE